LKAGSAIGVPSPPAMILPGGRLTTPHICDAERLQGFPPFWTAPASQVMPARYRWRLIGNAVNVRVAQWIGNRLSRPRVFVPNKVRKLSIPPWPNAAFNVDGTLGTCDVSEFPVRRRFAPLHEFLRFEPAGLSRKAASGVFRRLQSSDLNVPPILLARLKAHLKSFTNSED
jgi:DNA (cytosine-5)-methyltransferase 1